VGLYLFALVLDGLVGLCILAQMITSSETFDGLTITTYENHEIYIECAKPITTEILLSRLAAIRGVDKDKRSTGTVGHDPRLVHDAPEASGHRDNWKKG
jgi:hypothetical protein